ncbi:hypothetical protein JCM8208_000222 [Rhodotorula glutinis]
MATPRPPPAPPASTPDSRAPHLVSLKVLRATRPALVPEEPLVKALPGSQDARRAQQGEAGGTLSLPTSFANIYLGETFNAVLSLSNDLVPPSSTSSSSSSTSTSALTALSPVLHVEMHTNLHSPQPGATAPTPIKHLLAHVDPSSSSSAPAPQASLAPGEALPTLVVAHELKELGPHALVCTVSYGVEVSDQGEGQGGTTVVTRSFRKVYKFHVANPLSVRTKAHSPTSPLVSPTCALSPHARDKVFLEVQVHNHCEAHMGFERMRFVPREGWRVEGEEDAVRALGERGGEEGEGEGSAHGGGARRAAEPPLAPGAVRQFLYVLGRVPPSPTSLDAPPEPEPAPGTSQGLGRLDIVWRTANGEVGRLQSSTLGRRVPPRLGVAAGQEEGQEEEGMPSGEGLAFELVVDGVRPKGAARAGSTATDAPAFVVDEPFAVQLRLRVRSTTEAPHQRRRRLRLAAQHVEWHAPALGPLPPPSSSSTSSSSSSALVPGPSTTELSHRLGHASHPSGSALSLPLPGARPPHPPSHVHAHPPPPPHLHPSSLSQTPLDTPSRLLAPAQHDRRHPTLRGVRLPRAVPSPSSAGPAPPSPSPSPAPSAGIVRLGAGLVDLGEVVLEPVGGDALGAGGEAAPAPGPGRWHDVSWTWRFVPLVEGLLRVGGVRVLLVESGEGDEAEQAEGEGLAAVREGEERVARTVLEMDTVAEVWVEA